MHPARLPPGELLGQCAETRSRRSGPGGQHRNKVETAVVLLHRPTGIAAGASERRSQAENRAVCLRRLRLALAIRHRTPVESTDPSRLWRSRVRGQRLVVSAGHADFPALLAEALDLLQRTGWRMSPAAEFLGTSTSQLIGLFRRCPAAWTAVNGYRAAAGLPGLVERRKPRRGGSPPSA